MNTIGERIRWLRKQHLKMTLVDFGARLGISNPAVSMIETGKTNPSDQTIRAICREFGVNELWLRHGEEGGEMFLPRSRKDEIAAYMGKLLGGQRTELEEKIIEFMAKTDVKYWDMLLEIMRPLAEEVTQIEKPPDT